MDIDNLIAIDTHTHLEVSCRNPFDNYGEEYDRAADKYFRSSRRPTMDETLAYYRERKVGFVNFTVDAEAQLGRQRISNEEIAEAAMANGDIMIAFASIDPHKGKMGAREARRLIEEFGVKGFKFHPTVQGFEPQDRMAWPIYEVINEFQLPAIFHSGHSGIGSGMRCGGGLRLQNSNPMLLEDVAITFPDIQIVIAYPSWPWQDEAISLAMHKPNIWIDLSGWSPKYFPSQLVQYANTLLKDLILFGSDYPLITPDRWMKDFAEAGFKPEVQPLILKNNAVRLLNLGPQPVLTSSCGLGSLRADSAAPDPCEVWRSLVPMGLPLEGTSHRQETRLRSGAPDELNGQWQPARIEPGGKAECTPANVVDPSRELTQWHAALGNRFQRRCCAMHGGHQQHVISREPLRKTLAVGNARCTG